LMLFALLFISYVNADSVTFSSSNLQAVVTGYNGTYYYSFPSTLTAEVDGICGSDLTDGVGYAPGVLNFGIFNYQYSENEWANWTLPFNLSFTYEYVDGVFETDLAEASGTANYNSANCDYSVSFTLEMSSDTGTELDIDFEIEECTENDAGGITDITITGNAAVNPHCGSASTLSNPITTLLEIVQYLWN